MIYAALDHVGFAVSDLDRASEFYTFLLGDEPFLRKIWDVSYLGEFVGYPDAKLDAAFWRLPNGVVLELLQYLDPSPGIVDMETYNVGNAHLCLETDDLAAEFRRLADVATFRCDHPVDIPFGPYKGGRVAYLRDSDGITIELMQPPPGGPAF